VKNSDVVEALGGEVLRGDINEVLLLHGVPDLRVAKSILTNGMNERYSGASAGSAFGEGVYLAGARAHAHAYIDKVSFSCHGCALRPLI
jgi:hypothetical protein